MTIRSQQFAAIHYNLSQTKSKLNAPTAMVHDEHDDPMNTKGTPSIHREHRGHRVETWCRDSICETACSCELPDGRPEKGTPSSGPLAASLGAQSRGLDAFWQEPE